MLKMSTALLGRALLKGEDTVTGSSVSRLSVKHELCCGNTYTEYDSRSEEDYLTEPDRKGRTHRPVARYGEEMGGLWEERDMRAQSNARF